MNRGESQLGFLGRFQGESRISKEHSWYVGLEVTVVQGGKIIGTATYEINDEDTVICGTDGVVTGIIL